MKKLLLCALFSLFAISSFAQIQLINSNPANGDFAVNQDSIVLEFNLPIHFDVEYPEYSGFFFVVEPEDSVYFDSVTVSDDNLKVTFYGQLADDTDYMAVLAGAEGLSGEKLESPYIIQFTTADTTGDYTIHGKVSDTELEALKATSGSYNGVAVFLSHAPLDLGFTFDDTAEEDTTFEEDNFYPLYGATVDTTTGEYVITGVREDVYFPVGLNLFQIFSETEFSEFYFPDIYIYDPDGDLIPNEIEVNAVTTTDDTLSNIDLQLIDFSTFPFSEAVARAEHVITELDNDPVLVGGTTFYFYTEVYEDFSEKRAKTSFSTRELEIPNFRISNGGNFGNFGLSGFKAKTLQQNEEDPFGTPNGNNLIWEVYIYDAVKDSAAGILVTPFGSFLTGYLSIEDVDLPEGVSFSDFKPIPETYIDSDSAAAIIEAEGGATFREEFGVSNETEYGSWYMDLTALHSFWDYEPDPTPDAPVMWTGFYYGYKYSYETDEYKENFLAVFLDIETGEVLHTVSGSDSSSFDLISFSEALSISQEVLNELENDPVVLGGGTYFDSFSSEVMSKVRNEAKYRELKNRVTQKAEKSKISAIDHEHDTQTVPSGYQYYWEIYAYDAVKDSILFLFTTSFGAEFYGYLGEDDVELPDGVTFDSIKPLSENYIDSDSAATIIEAEGGGAAFREEFGVSNESETGYWFLWLEALHAYWEYPPDPTPDAPVLWAGYYYGSKYNYDTETYVDGYLTVFLDIETGEVLYEMMETDTLIFDPILFSEAVDLTQNSMAEFENDPVIIGGGTAYYYYDESFEDQPKALQAIRKKSEQRAERRFSKTAAYLDEHPTGYQYIPNGYQVDWEVFGYDADKDSALAFYVVSEGAEFYGYVGHEDTDLPEEVTFDSFKPLPETYIDSDSAASIMEEEGGKDFRAEFGVSTETEYGYWEMVLEALHNYWLYPPDPTPDAPVMWTGYYYGSIYNFETEEYREDSLFIFLDIETGEVLHRTPTSSEIPSDLPNAIVLHQNYPNPFNPSTNISFELNQSARVELSIYNVIGQKVATLVDDTYPAGVHIQRWNASNLASGVYFYRLTAAGVVKTRKLMLVK